MKLKVVDKSNNCIVIDCLYFEIFDDEKFCWLKYMPSDTEDCYTEYAIYNVVKIESL